MVIGKLKLLLFFVILAASIGAAFYFLGTGKEAYLLLPDGLYENQQSILLASSPELWESLKEVFQKDDLIELSRLFSLGVFDVGPGTLVRIIGENDGLMEVEIIGVVRSRDENKIGRRAWVGKEFISEKPYQEGK